MLGPLASRRALGPLAVGLRAGSTLLDGLVLYARCDEGSGVRQDLSGNGNHLTAYNNPGSDTGKIGSALKLVAASLQYVGRANADLVNWPLVDFYLSFWFNWTGANVESVVTKASSAGDQREWRISTLGGQTRLYLYASSTGGVEDVATNTGAGSITVPGWNFCELRRSGLSIGIAVNGGAFNSGNLSSVFNGSAPLLVGARNAGTYGHWDGLVDDLLVLNRVATVAERAENYARTSALL